MSHSTFALTWVSLQYRIDSRLFFPGRALVCTRHLCRALSSCLLPHNGVLTMPGTLGLAMVAILAPPASSIPAPLVVVLFLFVRICRLNTLHIGVHNRWGWWTACPFDGHFNRCCINVRSIVELLCTLYPLRGLSLYKVYCKHNNKCYWFILGLAMDDCSIWMTGGWNFHGVMQKMCLCTSCLGCGAQHCSSALRAGVQDGMGEGSVCT